MARKRKTVKIELDGGDTKDFTIKELSVKDIIDLSQQNSFFESKMTPTIKKSQNGGEMAETEPEKGLFDEIKSYSKEIEEIMGRICDFTIQDLQELAPSDLKELYFGFLEVNETFLDLLEKLQILQMFKEVLEKHIKNFSKVLAIL